MHPFLLKQCAIAATLGVLGSVASIATAAPIVTATSGAAIDNPNPNPTDAFNNATVSSSYPSLGSSFSVGDMFGGSASAETGHAIFAQNSGAVDTTAKTQTGVLFVNFNTATAVPIGGYNLYFQGDPGGHREATYSRLYGSNDGGATYDILLSSVQLNPILDGDTAPGDATNSEYTTLYGSTQITISDTFAAPVNYQYYRLELMTNPWVNPNGVRVIELDAQAVPEPASLGLLSLGLMGLLHRRRR